MQLYGSLTSPYVRHCRIALKQNDQNFELVLTDHDQSLELSPTARVPFLKDDQLSLWDSTAILAHVRRKAGHGFLDSPAQFDLYCLANTAMDAGIVLLLAERMDGLSETDSKFLQRHRRRLEGSLDELERRISPCRPADSDATIRVACLLDWGRFRQRFELTNRSNLRSFLEMAREWALFMQTSPDGK